MLPQVQDEEGWPRGSCVQYAYATLLGIPAEQVPRFDPDALAQLGEEQGDRERAWLASIGYELFEISTSPDRSFSEEFLSYVPEVPHLMSGISPRGYGHRCVGIGGQLVHDPHPSQAGLLTVYSLGFLIPLEGP